MLPITPILLAGGLGTRLWPSSRKSYPKQFMDLTSNETLFQQSAQRVLGCDGLKFNPHIIITNSHFRFIVEEQLQAVGITPGKDVIFGISIKIEFFSSLLWKAITVFVFPKSIASVPEKFLFIP